MLATDHNTSPINHEFEAQLAALQRLNIDFQNLIEATGIGILFFDRDLNLKQYTPAMEALCNVSDLDLGHPACSPPHTLCYECLYKDAQAVLATRNPVKREIRTHSGHWYLVEMRPYGLDHRAEGVVTSFVDITTQKQTQHKLQERTKELKCLYAVAELFSHTDIPLESILQQTTALIPPSWQYPDITCARIIYQDQAFTSDHFRKTPWQQSASIVMGGTPVGSVDVYYLEERSTLDEGPFVHEERHLIETLARQLGILAERRHAVEILVRERNRAQLYLDVAGALFVVLDTNGCVTLINQKGCDILGYESEEILGKNWFDHFLPRHLADEARRVFEHLIAGDVEPVEYVENQVLTRTGVERSIRWHNTVIRDDAGQVVATLGSGTDTTEQATLEREVIRISEVEQRRFGRELHDGLGSHLSGLAMVSRSLAHELREGRPITPEDLDLLAGLAKDGVAQARALARGLNLVNFDAKGLAAALHELAADTQARSSIACLFIEEAAPFDLSDETVIQLYRIAQEAVHNAVQHAHAAHIHIRLYTEHDRLVLTVRDDGQGFAATPRHRDGMGLHIMPHRAHIIGATFRIGPAPGGGTMITCYLPIKREALPLPPFKC